MPLYVGACRLLPAQVGARADAGGAGQGGVPGGRGGERSRRDTCGALALSPLPMEVPPHAGQDEGVRQGQGRAGAAGAVQATPAEHPQVER